MRLETEEAVARRICELMYVERKAKKISQQKLCESLNITQGLLSKIENGKLNIQCLIHFNTKILGEVATSKQSVFIKVSEIKPVTLPTSSVLSFSSPPIVWSLLSICLILQHSVE